LFSIFGGIKLLNSKFAKKDKEQAKKMQKWSKQYFVKRLRMFCIANILFKLLQKTYKKYDAGTILSAWLDAGSLAVSIFANKYNFKNSYSFCHSFEVDPFKNKYVNLLCTSYIMRNLNKIIFISHRIMENYINLCKSTGISFDKAKFSIRYLGIMNNLHLPKIYKKNNNLINIVSCSSVVPVKRIDKIIDVLSKTKTNIEWTHFGGGPLAEEIKKMAENMLKHNVKVKFVGQIKNSDILDYYQKNACNIDCFINLSDSEGIPVSIMEAMSYGIPCIATNVGGTGEIVKSLNGWLVEIDDPSVKIAGIIDNMKINIDEYTQKRSNAFEMIKNNFYGKKNCKDFYLKLIDNIRV